MVTKTEVRNYYADKHDSRNLEVEDKICPGVVLEWLESHSEDETGLYWDVTKIIIDMETEYPSLEEVKSEINLYIKHLIKDLERITTY